MLDVGSKRTLAGLSNGPKQARQHSVSVNVKTVLRLKYKRDEACA